MQWRQHVGPSGLNSAKTVRFCLSESLSESVFLPGLEVIKLFSCSAQLSMKFSPLIDVKMPTIVGILTSMSGNCWHFNKYEREKYHSRLN